MTNPQISAETIEALRRIDSATIANAIEHFEVRDPVTGYASLELRCQFPENEPMVGFAVTATQDTTSAGDDRPNRLHDVLDMVAAAPKPVVLAVQYTGGDRMRSCLAGDMFCSALQKLGGVGIVTDLGSRDFQGIAQRAAQHGQLAQRVAADGSQGGHSHQGDESAEAEGHPHELARGHGLRGNEQVGQHERGDGHDAHQHRGHGTGHRDLAEADQGEGQGVSEDADEGIEPDGGPGDDEPAPGKPEHQQEHAGRNDQADGGEGERLHARHPDLDEEKRGAPDQGEHSQQQVVDMVA